MNLLSRIIKDCSTVANGEDFDVGRILGTLGVFMYFVLCAVNWAKFDPQTYGIGFAAVIAGMAAALAIQHKTEPGEIKE
jgi:hypothetical protein